MGIQMDDGYMDMVSENKKGDEAHVRKVFTKANMPQEQQDLLISVMRKTNRTTPIKSRRVRRFG